MENKSTWPRGWEPVIHERWVSRQEFEFLYGDDILLTTETDGSQYVTGLPEVGVEE